MSTKKKPDPTFAAAFPQTAELQSFQKEAVALLAAEQPRVGDVWACMENRGPPTRGKAKRWYDREVASGRLEVEPPHPPRRCRVAAIDGTHCEMRNVETNRMSKVALDTLRAGWELVERDGEAVK